MQGNGGPYLKKLHICVKEVSFGDMNPLEAELMNQLQDAGGYDSLSAGAGAGKGPL